MKDFLDRQGIFIIADDQRSRQFLLTLLSLDLEMKARAGFLTPQETAVREYVRLFPQLTVEDRQLLTRKEREWLNSPKTIIVSAGNAHDKVTDSIATQTPEIRGYAELTRVGQGALGVVYRATQLGSNKAVAIKCIRPELEMDDKARQLFVREASILSGLKHPRVVECLGFGFCGLRPYLVMEFVPAEDLEQLVWNHGPQRRVRLAVKVIRRLLEALIHAHKAGIVHRDIKPSNILASIVRNRLQLKVSDFGLAKFFETAGHSGITKSGEMCGTVAYMSPEQFLDSRRAKPECDVYSAVVCLYRLLTKEFPHPDGTHSQVIQHRMNQDIRSPLEFNPEIPEELAQVLERGLARFPKDRYRTAQSLHDALSAMPFLDG